jgi:hypothetical protein
MTALPEQPRVAVPIVVFEGRLLGGGERGHATESHRK